MVAHFILYVKDQKTSTEFYSKALGLNPQLNVPGMTEFALSESAILGLMPMAGARRLLGEVIPEHGSKTPRAEIYLLVEDPSVSLNRAIGAGAMELSPCQARDWGHEAGYCLDPDGHVLAFAKTLKGAQHE